jgi:hypothetical protein
MTDDIVRVFLCQKKCVEVLNDKPARAHLKTFRRVGCVMSHIVLKMKIYSRND